VWRAHPVPGVAQRGRSESARVQEEGLAESLMDENAMAKAPRPGTSMQRGNTANKGGDRPSSSAVRRPLTGFARPGTQRHGHARPGWVGDRV
jgi:hypothetical protein